MRDAARSSMEPSKASTPKSPQEGDVTLVLREKLREQAQQLSDLQKRCSFYEAQMAETPSQTQQRVRELERRLADLTRPIPLSDSLSFPPPSVSLSLSQLMELYSLLYVRMNELLKEREELQANLHEEILFSEEQSVILETMREEMAGSRTHRRSESAQTETEELRDDQKTSADALAEAYAEIAKLEEEKNALLEYVEQQAEREAHAQSQISHLQDEEKRLQSELATMKSVQETLSASTQEVHRQDLAARGEEVRKLSETLEKTQKELQLLQVKHAETMGLLEELRDFRQSEEAAQLSALQEAQSARLEDENKSLRQMLSQLQSEIESLHSTQPKPQTPRESLSQPKVDQSTLTDEDVGAKEAVHLCQSQIASLNASFSALLSVLDRPSA